MSVTLVAVCSLILACSAQQNIVRRVNTSELLEALGRDVLTKRSGLKEDATHGKAAPEPHVEESGACSVQCDMEMFELRKTVEKLQKAYDSLCKEVRHLSGHVLLHEYAFRHIATSYHVTEKTGARANLRFPEQPEEGHGHSQSQKVSQGTIATKTKTIVTRTQTSVQKRQRTINNGTHTIIHTSLQKIVDGTPMEPENHTEVVVNAPKDPSQAELGGGFLTRRRRQNVRELDPSSEPFPQELIPVEKAKLSDPSQNARVLTPTEASVQTPIVPERGRVIQEIQEPDSRLSPTENGQSVLKPPLEVNPEKELLGSGASGGNVNQNLDKKPPVAGGFAQQPDLEIPNVNEVDVPSSQNVLPAKPIRQHQEKPTEPIPQVYQKPIKPEPQHEAKPSHNPSSSTQATLDTDDSAYTFDSNEAECGASCKSCSVLHKVSLSSEIFQQKFKKWYKDLTKIDQSPIAGTTKTKLRAGPGLKVYPAGASIPPPQGFKSFEHHQNEEAPSVVQERAAKIDKMAEEMDRAVDQDATLYATCNIKPNRHISLILQEDVEGRINLWQNKYGGPVNMHLKLRGFRKHPNAPRSKAKRESNQILIEQEPGEQGQLVSTKVVYSRIHGFHVHEHGNLTKGCQSTGPHYNPKGMSHGGPMDGIRHVGDLGNIRCDDEGEIDAEMSFPMISLTEPHSIIGRSLVIHAQQDDFGKDPSNPASTATGNSGAKIACCVIEKADKLEGDDSRSLIAPIRGPKVVTVPKQDLAKESPTD